MTRNTTTLEDHLRLIAEMPVSADHRIALAGILFAARQYWEICDDIADGRLMLVPGWQPLAASLPTAGQVCHVTNGRWIPTATASYPGRFAEAPGASHWTPALPGPMLPTPSVPTLKLRH